MYEINRNASVEYTPRAPMQAIVVYFKTKCKPSVRNLKLKIIKQYAIKLSKNSYYEPRSYIYQVISQLVCEKN